MKEHYKYNQDYPMVMITGAQCLIIKMLTYSRWWSHKDIKLLQLPFLG